MAVAIQSAPEPVAVGGTVTYTVTARNRGPHDADAVTVRIVLGSHLSFLSATASRGTCEGAPAVTCAIGSVAPGEQVEVTVLARAAATGVASSTATAHGTDVDPNPSDNAAAVVTTIVAAPPEPPA